MILRTLDEFNIKYTLDSIKCPFTLFRSEGLRRSLAFLLQGELVGSRLAFPPRTDYYISKTWPRCQTERQPQPGSTNICSSSSYYSPRTYIWIALTSRPSHPSTPAQWRPPQPPLRSSSNPPLHPSIATKNPPLTPLHPLSQLLHSLTHHNPNRTHHLRLLANLLPRLTHPPQNNPRQTPKTNLHPQPKLHPLHRRRALGPPFRGPQRGGPHIPSHRLLILR